MVDNKFGRILFFVGDGAFSGRGSGRAHISAAKMGLIGLARGLASEFAPHKRADIERELAEIHRLLEQLGYRRSA